MPAKPAYGINNFAGRRNGGRIPFGQLPLKVHAIEARNCVAIVVEKCVESFAAGD
jgi:hypothetical protein